MTTSGATNTRPHRPVTAPPPAAFALALLVFAALVWWFLHLASEPPSELRVACTGTVDVAGCLEAVGA